MKATRFPGIKKLPNGKFEIRVKTTDPKTGREKDIKKVVTATNAAQANEMREHLRRATLEAETTRNERLRVREYAERWLRGKAPALKKSSLYRYAETLDLHILPQLGDYYLDALSPADVTAWRDAQIGRPATVNGRLRVLRTMLRDAVADLDLPRDPCGRVRTLREKRDEDDPNRLTSEELRELLEVFRRDHAEWYPLVLTLALTGARFGEASALKWTDIDEKNGVIRIRRSHWRGTVDSTKTGSSRTVPLPDVLRDALRDQRRRLVVEQNPGLSEGWVFPSRAGTLLFGPSLRKPMRAACRTLGLDRRQTIHGLRRTFNNLVRQVATGEVVRSMTGHVTEAMTEHYSHVELEEKRRAVATVFRDLATESGRSGGRSGP